MPDLRAIDWDDAALDRLSSVDDEDVDGAVDFWRSAAPTALADLLDADVDEGSDEGDVDG